jgi:hypothetical protein
MHRLLALAALVLAGCGLRGPASRALPPATAPQLVAELAARRAAVTSLRARARLRAGLKSAWVRQAILVRRPAAVRIDVLSPVGLALALGADGGILWAYPPAERTRYEGPATPANMRRVLGAPIALSDVVDILLGVPPARVPTGAPRLTVTSAGEYRLALPLEDGEQLVWFAGDPLAVRRAEEIHDGGPSLRVAFDDYEDGFPRTIALDAPGTGAVVNLTYAAVEPNAVLDPGLFAPPPGPRVLPLTVALRAAP